MADLQENMVVADRFRLVRMIGRGGMGSVWRAVQVGLERPCAVKFIEGELASVAEAHARFEREARAAAQLNTPNVVQIFEHGVWQGRPYIAMELLEGEDLGSRLAKNGGRLTPSDVNFVVQQVCRALSRAHQAGVVHRDLKPDNIFIVRDDDRDIVKILDFGVAKSAAGAIDGSNTKTGAMLGTPYYMSPEQAQGIKSVDARSDLWSLAVIVFQCLTGRLPFESEALGDLLVKIIVNPIPKPSDYDPRVPVGFDAWWAKAADRNPDNRHANAKQFAESLTIALGQSSVSDVTGRLHRNSEKPSAGATMAVHAPGTEVLSHVANTPQPGAQTAAMVTPNPMHTPPGMQGIGPGQHGGFPMGPPVQGQPVHPSYARGSPHVTTANPVAQTFSGLDVKKSPPVLLFVGIAALAFIGLGLGGFALVRGRSAAAGAVSDQPASSAVVARATTSAPVTVDSAPVATPAENAPAKDPAAKDPSPLASAAPSASSPVAAATPPQHRPGAGQAAKPVQATASAKTTGAPPVAATAKPVPTQKPVNLGF